MVATAVLDFVRTKVNGTAVFRLSFSILMPHSVRVRAAATDLQLFNQIAILNLPPMSYLIT